MSTTTLRAFLAELRTAPIVPRPPEESWADLIARTAQPGVACAIHRDTYDYFLDVLPPKYQGLGFAFAEGAEALRYFWHLKSEQCFSRQLTWEETEAFCRLASIPLPH